MSKQKIIIVVACGALIVAISMGIRQSFGIFLRPMSADMGTGREIFSLAIAIQNLVLGLPLMGIVADRFGPRWVVLLGGLLYGIGLLMIPYLNTEAGLYLVFGVTVGLALSSTTYVVVLGAVAQVVPAERRSSWFGVITAGGSLGMFLIVPGIQALVSNVGWQTSFIILAGVVSCIALLALGLPNKAGSQHTGGSEEYAAGSLPQILNKARSNSGYLLLNAGFFVCGFHVAFIATHLPAFLADKGVAPMAGAIALALIGFANIFGSYLFGYLGDRYRKKFLLSLLYFGRAVVISFFLLLPITNVSAILFGAAIGFLWLATVPLTSGMIAQIFGSRYLATMFGIVFFSHQIGAFLGVWLGGRLYDTTGSYTLVWMIAIGLGVAAAVLHLPISDSSIYRQPAQQPTESAA